jgi:Txe/YoeB family toxin of Txe-Axe toxin-antitoxin module
MKRNLLFWIPVMLFVAGCASAPKVIEKATIEKKDTEVSVVKPAEESPAVTLRLFEDRDLLLTGVALLNPQDRPDPEKARSVFASLVQRFPQSRWRPAAEAFIHLIDERDAFWEANRQDHLLIGRIQWEKTKALQENDRLKKTVRELTEKLQSETAALTQENEQLKKDIARLKALEIELEKRERKLR